MSGDRAGVAKAPADRVRTGRLSMLLLLTFRAARMRAQDTEVAGRQRQTEQFTDVVSALPHREIADRTQARERAGGGSVGETR